MGKDSAISWTNHTFNTWWGCDKVSPGCKHCYAATFANRLGQGWGRTAPRRFFEDDAGNPSKHWREPLKWNAEAQRAGVPAFVFCASMADVFEDEPEHVREQTARARGWLWILIAETPWLTWLLLTKRPERVAEVVPAAWMDGGWPSNVWIGCTVEDQEHAEKRLPHLLDVPAPRHFVSYEPALGPVDFTRLDVFKAPTWPESLPGEPKTYLDALRGEGLRPSQFGVSIETVIPKGIDWLIIGGESGGKARPFRAEWARSTIRQCQEAGVDVWMKQAGGDPRDDARGETGVSAWPGGIHGLPHPQGGGILRGFGPVLRDRAGADPAEWPDDLRVQRRPEPLPLDALAVSK